MDDSLQVGDSQMFEFIDTLVQAIVGYSLIEIPEENILELIQDCVNIFSDFIIQFASDKYGPKEGIRLKASQQFAGEDIFAKFRELGDIFEEAFGSFINVLQADLALQVAN